MTLNNLGIMMYGTALMYIIVYWILWFFKVPYYKKMSIHRSEPVQITFMAYFVLGTFCMGLELTARYAQHDPNPPAMVFWIMTVISIICVLFCITKVD